MEEPLWWDEEDIAHLDSRSTRYPGAVDIEPAWTREAQTDAHRVTRNPDPKSHGAHLRLIGYSATADLVITVIVDPEDWSGVTAWKISGADLRDYLHPQEPTP